MRNPSTGVIPPFPPSTADGSIRAGHRDGVERESIVIERGEEKPRVEKPSFYKVVLMNDDYTPMEFVVHLLRTIFTKSLEEANRIMLHIHRRGSGVCGVYPYQIAETKAHQVIETARSHEHPLQCLVEKDS